MAVSHTFAIDLKNFYRSILAFLEDENEYLWHGILYAFLLLTVTILRVTLFSYFNVMAYRIGLQIETALVSAIYKKVEFSLSH